MMRPGQKLKKRERKKAAVPVALPHPGPLPQGEGELEGSAKAQGPEPVVKEPVFLLDEVGPVDKRTIRFKVVGGTHDGTVIEHRISWRRKIAIPAELIKGVPARFRITKRVRRDSFEVQEM